MPAGFTPDGLPVGIQIVGRYRDDLGVLQFAHAFEQATEFGPHAAVGIKNREVRMTNCRARSHERISSSLIRFPPRIAILSASLSPGVAST